MGCICSNHVDDQAAGANNTYQVVVRNPRPWSSNERMSRSELREMRQFFWRQAPSAYGGRPAIWEVLEDAAACHDNLRFKQEILSMNNITLGNPPDMTVCFDDNDHRYELPLRVLSEPTNLY